MTSDQMTLLKEIVNPQLSLLLRAKNDLHNNKWTEEFDSNFLETKENLIWQIEGLILNPTETIKPLARIFKQEDEPERHEIRRLIAKLFWKFKKDNNDYIEFELPDYSEITSEGKRMLLEKVIKHNGIWKVNKNDADDIFPSDPHADRVDDAEKLNLYTGDVYSKTNKQYLRTLPKKAMIYIYNELMKCKEESIKTKLLSRKAEIIYLKTD